VSRHVLWLTEKWLEAAKGSFYQTLETLKVKGLPNQWVKGFVSYW